MAFHREELTFRTGAHNEVLDITREVRVAVKRSGAEGGVCTVFTPHATAAITVNENDDPNIGRDFLEALKKMVPELAGWRHDEVDENAASHIKAGLIGPSESIPVQGGELLLGRWQDIFLCEFDGPRSDRRVIVTVTW